MSIKTVRPKKLIAMIGLAMIMVALSAGFSAPNAHATEYANVYVGNDWSKCVSDDVDVCIQDGFKPVDNMTAQEYGVKLAAKLNVKKIILIDSSNPANDPYDLHQTESMPYTGGDALQFEAWYHDTIDGASDCLYSSDEVDYLKDSVVMEKKSDGTWTSSLSSTRLQSNYNPNNGKVDANRKSLDSILKELPHDADPLSALDKLKNYDVNAINLKDIDNNSIDPYILPMLFLGLLLIITILNPGF